MSDGGVLLTSGGLDSTTMAYWLAKRGLLYHPLFINYGQHCAATELDTAKRVLPTGDADRLSVVNLSDVYRGTTSRLIAEPDLWQDKVAGDDLYLPYRNLLLMTAAAAFAQARHLNVVYAAFINSNHAKEIDCSARFFDTLGDVLSDYGGVRITMPFRDMTKFDVVCLALDHGVPIGTTYSCQASSAVPCGACPNCVDRLEALRKAELL